MELTEAVLTKTMLDELARPFTLAAVKYKPLTNAGKDGKAIAAWYIDARLAAARLNAIVGPANWEDEYRLLADGQFEPALWFPVECTLTVFGIRKTDVGCYQRNSADDKAFKSAYCLPLDAQALTENGWRYHDEIEVGERILAYDRDSGLCRWTPLLCKNVYRDPQPVVSLAGKSFAMTCTPEHRWVVRRRGVPGERLLETSGLMSRDAILLAAPAEGGEHPLTAREAAILGWLATDGWVGEYRRRNRMAPELRAVINQSKPEHVGTLTKLLKGIAAHNTTPPGERLFPGRAVASPTLERHVFTLRPTYARELLRKTGLRTGDWLNLSEIVTRLSREARTAMWKAMLAGDGQHSGQQLVFGKKRKPGVMEAFELLATLEGFALGRTRMSTAGALPLRTVREQKQTWAKALVRADAEPEPVWCPMTAFGTWVTRWRDTVCITGNSDALKRAAVKFGIGAYLYAIPRTVRAEANTYVDQAGKQRTQGFTEAGELFLKRAYERWLASPLNLFGDPLDHGDVGEDDLEAT